MSDFDGAIKNRDAIAMKLAVVRAAISQNARKTEAARDDASRRIAEARKPGFVSILRDVKTAIVALKTELAKERKFRQECEADGISLDAAGLRPMWLNEWPMDSWLESAATYYGV